jgi:hypothetical protein
MIDIKVGQIWQVVTDNFYTSDRSDKIAINNDRRYALVNLNRNEFIEIRYAFAWHFRTYDDLYLHAYPKEILKHCRLIGNIDEEIRFKNHHNLSQILADKLYKPIWED